MFSINIVTQYYKGVLLTIFFFLFMLFNMDKSVIIADLCEGKTMALTVESQREGLEFALELQSGDDIVFLPLVNSFSNSGYLIVFRSLYDKKLTYLRGNTALFSLLPILGHSALVIRGGARKLSYLTIRKDGIELLSCENLRSNSPFHTFEILSNGDDGILAIGEAGEKCVYSAALFSSDNNEYFSSSIGAIFGSKNLKSIVIESAQEKIEANAKIKKKIARSSIVKKLKREGSTMLIDQAYDNGWINNDYFSATKDPRSLHLDGFCQSRIIAATSDACKSCLISCRRKGLKGTTCPGFRETMALGSALGFYSYEKIMRFTEACVMYGLSPNECGLILASLKRCDSLPFTYPQLRNANEDEISRVISLIGQKKGIGESVSKLFDREYLISSHPQLIDLRGAGIEAIFELYGEGDSAYPDLLLGLTKKYSAFNLGYIACYLRAYHHAFMLLGVPHVYPIPLIYEKLFKYAPDKLFILKYKLNHISFMGKKSNELLKSGLSSMLYFDEKRGGEGKIDKLFTDEVRDDGSLLNLTRLKLGYEKALNEIKSFFRC